MKLIHQSFEILDQQPGIEGVYKMIEYAGRTCYKSTDRITEDSAKEFIDRIINYKHLSVLEHGTIYLIIPSMSCKYIDNKYSKVNIVNNNLYVTTNARVLFENDWVDDLQYICEPTEHHEKRVVVKFITDQGILREFTRHRVFSFSVESTRYCNYSRSKFNKEITYIYPCWLYGDDISKPAEECFRYALHKAEQAYFQLLNEGWKPQQARNVLPLATKCEMVMTGFASDWEHFFKLRDAESAHPQAQELAKPLHEEFLLRGIITEK